MLHRRYAARMLDELTSEKILKIEEHGFDLWQARWDVIEDGHDLFPDTRCLRRASWISPNKYVTQFLSGHEAFRCKLARLGLVDTVLCLQ